MSPRERRLVFIFVGIGAAAILGYVFYQMILIPYGNNQALLKKLKEDLSQKDDAIFNIEKDQARLKHAKQWSLPSSLDRAVAEYRGFIDPFLRECGLTVDDFQTPNINTSKFMVTQQTGKKPGHIVLPFRVQAKGEMSALVKALDGIRKKPIMHRVQSLTIQRQDPAEKSTNTRLVINMTLEALVVNRAQQNWESLFTPGPTLVALEGVSALAGGPRGLMLTGWTAGRMTSVEEKKLALLSERRYADMGKKNLFVGLIEPPVVREEEPVDPWAGIDFPGFVRLETTLPLQKEAYFRHLLEKAPNIRVKAMPRSGYDTFRVQDEARTKIWFRAKVLRVDQRDVFFQVGEDLYKIHIGQSLSDAMRRPLSILEVDDYELEGLYDEEWANQELPESMKSTQKKSNRKKSR